MKIELCEDNGFLNDGKPTLVVLVIDGKTRIPYEATKTIQELYEDVGKFALNSINKEASEISGVNIISEPSADSVYNSIQEMYKESANQIQKEDIVKCVKIHPREEGADCDLEVGDEYRVLSISKNKGQDISYDVVDDNSPTPFRIKCMPDEVSLLRKRKIKTNPVKKDYKQEMMKCSNCGTQNALNLCEDESIEGHYQKYVGNCSECKSLLIMPKPYAKSS